MNTNEKDTYFVAVKLFLHKNNKLLILKDNFGDWDLPGGRIKKDEFDIPLENILKRKITEELGSKISYTIDKPTVFMRHERKEVANGNPVVRIFAVGYSGTLDKEKIILSTRHPQMKWVNINTFNPEKYFIGGWLKGVQEYIKTFQKS